MINSRLRVDVASGKAYWLDATKYHARLNGQEAGCQRTHSNGKSYWHIKIDGTPYLRSAIVFAVANGRWPALTIDHANGDSLDDRAINLREATVTQNAWNHKRRAKASPLPMGVRQLGSRYQARIAVNKSMIHLGCYSSPDEAAAVYQTARATHFGEFA